LLRCDGIWREIIGVPCSRCWASLRICAMLQPRWFGVRYRLSLRLGFYSSQFIGRCVLVGVFCLHYNADGNFIALAGKDALHSNAHRLHDPLASKVQGLRPLDRLSEETTFTLASIHGSLK